MANEEHVAILKKGVDAGNEWRKKNPQLHVNLRGADLREASLSGAILRAFHGGADLREANLSGADLSEAVLRGADLRKANLSGANLSRGDLTAATLGDKDLTGADPHRCRVYGISAGGPKLGRGQ